MFPLAKIMERLNYFATGSRKERLIPLSHGKHRNRKLSLEILENRQLLSISPYMPIAVTADLGQEVSVPLSEASNGASSVGNFTCEDLGDSYWADGRQIALWRTNAEMVLEMKASANVDSLMADLVNAGGLLSSLQIDETLNDKILTLSSASGPLDNIDTTLANLASLSEVEWASPAFINSETNEPQYVTDDVIVQLQPGIDPQTFFTTDTFSSYVSLLASGNQYIGTMASGGALATLSEANALRSDSRVAWASPNFFSQIHFDGNPNDPFYTGTSGTQWSLNGTNGANLPAAWDVTTGSSNVVVAVLDCGIQIDHPDLYNNIQINQGEIPASVRSHLTDIDVDGLITFSDLNNSANSSYVTDFNSNGHIDANDLLQDSRWVDNQNQDSNGYIDDLCGWDFVNTDRIATPTTQYDNHGTAVAGVAAAQGNNGIGVSGAAQHVKILPVKIASDTVGDGDGFVSSATIANAVYYAAGINSNGTTTWRGADVINCSWGGGAPDSTLNTAFTLASTNGRGGKGCAIFVSSGNSASGYYPFPISRTITGLPTIAEDWSWVISYKKDAGGTAGLDTAWLADFTNGDGSIQQFNSSSMPDDWSIPTGAPFSGLGWSVVDDPSHAYGTGRYELKANAIGNNQEAFIMAPRVHIANSISCQFKTWLSSLLGDKITVYLYRHSNNTLYNPYPIDNLYGYDFTKTSNTNIPSPGTLASTLNVNTQITPIQDLNVNLNITHPNDSDLTVTLRSPQGTQITLFSGIGGSGDNFTNTFLDDEAATAIGSGTAPFTGSFRPSSLLSVFDGQNPNGTWTLSVTDSTSSNSGILNNWTLEIISNNLTIDPSPSYPANLSTTIPGLSCVGASTDCGYRADYSQYGSSLSFVAPSSGGFNGITTTDRTGALGYNPSTNPNAPPDYSDQNYTKSLS